MVGTESIRAFIAEELVPEVTANELEDDRPLLEGLLDSVNLFRLVAFLEEEFSVVIEDDELTPQNLGSLSSIARFLEAKRAD